MSNYDVLCGRTVYNWEFGGGEDVEGAEGF